MLWMLVKELGIKSPGQYMLLGHSLGTDYCSIIMNDPRLNGGDSILRPARLVLLDAICFGHEVPEAHRLPFWTLEEAINKHDGRAFSWSPIVLALLLFVIRDEYNQEVTKRALVPGTDVLFRCSKSLLKKCPTLVCLSGNDQALPAWDIRDYISAQYPEVQLRMDPMLEHGGFLLPFLPGWLARCHLNTVLSFLDSDISLLPRAASYCTSDAMQLIDGCKGLLRQKSHSGMSLAITAKK